MCEALYEYLIDNGIFADEDYIDDETFRIMAMDAEICERSSAGQQHRPDKAGVGCSNHPARTMVSQRKRVEHGTVTAEVAGSSPVGTAYAALVKRLTHQVFIPGFRGSSPLRSTYSVP